MTPYGIPRQARKIGAAEMLAAREKALAHIRGERGCEEPVRAVRKKRPRAVRRSDLAIAVRSKDGQRQ